MSGEAYYKQPGTELGTLNQEAWPFSYQYLAGASPLKTHGPIQASGVSVDLLQAPSGT